MTEAQLDPGSAQDRYGWSAFEEAWRLEAKRFAEAHAPHAREADRAGHFSKDVVLELGRRGLLGAALPVHAGGGGATNLADCLIAEEIGAVDGSVRGFLAVQIGLVASTLANHGLTEHQEPWLPGLLSGEVIGCYALTEEEAGSDVGAIGTRVRDDGGHVVIDGEKVWITNGGVADVALVFGSADPNRGTKGLECWVVPTDARGLTRERMPGKELGHRASDHARLTFDGVRIPKSQRLGPAFGGFRVAMDALEHGRLNVAAGAVGIQRACLEACAGFARKRRQFGRRIGDFQQVGATLAEMATTLECSRLLTYHAARLRDRDFANAGAVSAAKLCATEGALRAAKDAIQIHGSRGYTDLLALERHYRDAIGLTIYEGTSNVQRLILARRLLGKDDGR